MSRHLLITDLDNTLYDWVTFFAAAFTAMSKELSGIVNVEYERLLDEFRVVHRHYGSSEHPFAALDLPSVHKRFPGASRSELKDHIDACLHAFNRVRKQTLKLYEGVSQTLTTLRERGVMIVGHTESIAENALFRLRSLGIIEHFSHLYVLESKLEPHPLLGRRTEWTPPPGFVEAIPISERKPNPRLVLDIAERMSAHSHRVVYVGDSLTRDMSMAKQAGVTAVWARYGTRFDPSAWSTLVRVSHWTEDDVRREAELKRNLSVVRPDYTIDSFRDLLDLEELACSMCTATTPS